MKVVELVVRADQIQEGDIVGANQATVVKIVRMGNRVRCYDYCNAVIIQPPWWDEGWHVKREVKEEA